MNAKRVPSLDGLRGIAAIFVMFFHFDVFFLPQARISDIIPFVSRSYLSVDLFFLLSGFVMSHVYGRRLALNWRDHWLQFLIARFARLYPLFSLTTLIMLAIFILSGCQTPGISFSISSLALQPFLLQEWAPGLNWNYSSWSISTETEAYILFVFLAGPLIIGKYYRWIAIGCCAILAALSIVHHGSLNFFHGVPALLRTVVEFCLGVLLYRAHINGPPFRVGLAVSLMIVFVVFALVTRQDCLVVGALTCLIYYVVEARYALGWLLNARLTVALGNWSYSIYLWHVPIYAAITAAFAASGYPVSDLSGSNAKLLLLVTTLIVVGFSAVTYRYFEAPMRRSVACAITDLACSPRRR
jgi:peptidoglycan/LPS O-acetylase OafA/YrhL